MLITGVKGMDFVTITLHVLMNARGGCHHRQLSLYD